jgi:hypothetical protein
MQSFLAVDYLCLSLDGGITDNFISLFLSASKEIKLLK